MAYWYSKGAALLFVKECVFWGTILLALALTKAPGLAIDGIFWENKYTLYFISLIIPFLHLFHFFNFHYLFHYFMIDWLIDYLSFRPIYFKFLYFIIYLFIYFIFIYLLVFYLYRPIFILIFYLYIFLFFIICLFAHSFIYQFMTYSLNLFHYISSVLPFFFFISWHS